MKDKLKKCPFCAETIKAEAIVCRYCNRDLPINAKTIEYLEKSQSNEIMVSSPKMKNDYLVIIIVAIFVLAGLGLLLNNIAPTFFSRTARIDWSGDEVYCFGSEIAFNQYDKALDEEDAITFAYIVNEPDTILVDNHTKIKVLIKGKTILSAAKIQILEGYYKGRSCWTYQLAVE